MLSKWQTRAILVVLGIGSTLGAAAASAQTTATQVLDRVNAVSPKAVLDMAFSDPAATNLFEIEITTDDGFSSCQLTANRGLFCLDRNADTELPGRWVRNWDPVFAENESTKPYFSCEDKNLGLDTSKSVESCTSITADDNGAVVIAGKRKGGYNLIKVARASDLNAEPADDSCPDAEGWNSMRTAGLCYKVLLPRDRPLLVDITYATLSFGPTATDPDGGVCSGVIGLENRTALMFFRDPDDPANRETCPAEIGQVELVAARAWIPALERNEVLQGAATVKFNNGRSYVLVVSNTGRVRAKQTNSTAPSFSVPLVRDGEQSSYDTLALLRGSRGTEPEDACNAAPQKFGIRTSTKSGRLYVTDYNFCEVSALEPVAPLEPENGRELASSSGLKIVQFASGDLVLSTTTNDAAAISYPPLEPTLAPGISIDLSKCFSTEGCGLVIASDGQNDGQQIATLSNVKLVGNETGMTLFQIKGLPDCRWISPKPAACTATFNGIGTVSGGSTPETQYLNITPLLPKEVTDQFPPGSLPPMYISPQYRAQFRNGYLFEAFFGVTQDGVVFQDMAQLRLDVGKLSDSGNEWNCPQTPPKGPVSLPILLEWDVTVTVSEKVDVVGGPDNAPGNAKSDMLTNIGCGSTRSGVTRWSGYAYNLEMNKHAYDADHEALEGKIKTPPDDYFAHLVVDLFYDLWETQEKACYMNTALGAATSDSTPAVDYYCGNLEAKWLNAKSKLETCLSGSNFPKKNEAVNNCTAFVSQLDGYLGLVETVPQCAPGTGDSCPDADNRLGELETRARSVRYAFTDRLLPSIPTEGFQFPVYEGLNNGLLPSP